MSAPSTLPRPPCGWLSILASITLLVSSVGAQTEDFSDLSARAEAGDATDLYLGMIRGEVIAALGDPISEAVRGNEEILFFAGNVRIELRDGVVRKIRGAP